MPEFEMAAAPFRAAGEGFAGAVDQGVRAYATTSGVRQREAEGTRSQERLDMVKQLQPGMMRAQDLAAREKEMNIEAAGDKIARGRVLRERMESINQDVKDGKLKNPIEFHERMLDATIAGGEPEHIRQAMTAHQGLLMDTEKSKQDVAAIGIQMDLIPKLAAAKNGEERARIYAEAAETIHSKFPLAAASSPFYKANVEHMNREIENTQPPAIVEAWKKFHDSRVQNPKLSPTAAWHAAESELPPEMAQKWQAIKPDYVKNDESVRLAGAKAGAEAEAKLPTHLKEIEAREVSAEKLARRKAELRAEFRGMDPKAAKLEADKITQRLGQIEGRLKDPRLDPKDKVGLESQRAELDDALNAALRRAHEGGAVTGKPAAAPTAGKPAAAAPAGGSSLTEIAAKADASGGAKKPGAAPATAVRNQVILDARGKIDEALRSGKTKLPKAEFVKRVLDHNLANGEITQAEHDRLMQLYRAP
jgi:hypothetical protein